MEVCPLTLKRDGCIDLCQRGIEEEDEEDAPCLVMKFSIIFSSSAFCYGVELIARINLRMGRIHSRNLRSCGRWNI